MNPYDFARIDPNTPPARRRPIWHHRLTGQGTQRLYAGQIEVDILAETPMFVSDPRTVPNDPTRPAQSIKNQQGEYIIPGSSLKGMLRNVVETLGNGCFTLFDGLYERGRVDYRGKIPPGFEHCGTNGDLCIACRMFGMLKERARGVFMGKINIDDACAYPDEVYMYEPIYTILLGEPKPHHQDFYLDVKNQYIAGRKFYFHHSPDQGPLVERGPRRGGNMTNRYIQPLDKDTRFQVRIDFTNLEADEFAALLLAITLEEKMRHKIGFGKPMGLGSVHLIPTRLTLVDYANRYTSMGEGRGQSVLEGDELDRFVKMHIADFSRTKLARTAMTDLRRIWAWPPDPDVEYYYPSKRDWFDTDESIGKRIADTKDTP
jgi:CRISPR/Cas system CSM-associated protein Csm3 (group 7 of RAMP superfamily)